MNKKSLILGVCAVFVIAALVASLIFVFGGKEENSPQNEVISLKGTWVVVANFSNNAGVFTEEQFMVFTDTQAAMYKDAAGEAYAESSYTVSDAKQLILPEISREYVIDQKTENCVRLYDSENSYMLLVRSRTAERELQVLNREQLTGRWNVSFKGDNTHTGEVVDFADGTFSYYKDAAGEPYATSVYTLEENVLAVNALGLNMRCYMIDADTLVLVEESGVEWELAK